MESTEAAGLTNKLRLIQELKYKLLHVEWAREPFVLLARILQDMRPILEHQPNDDNAIATQYLISLQTLIIEHLRDNRLPAGDERSRLLTLLDDLLRALDHSDIFLEYPDNVSATLVGKIGEITPQLGGNVLLVANSGVRALSVKLEHANFQVWHCDTPEDARSMLLRTSLVSAIIDLDLTTDATQLLDLVRQLDARIASQLSIFFISERSDFAARLAAVHANGAGYFTKPVDSNALIEQLYERLSNTSVHGRRVLIINDAADAATKITQELQSKGITTHVVSQPQRLIQAIYQFQPQLLILDLAIKLVDATDLAKLIRQHELCHDIPMILLAESDSDTLRDNLVKLGIGENDILLKPLTPEYLLTVVSHRLRQANTIRYKLQNLHSKDVLSNLYNRRYFLSQLEHALADQPEAVAIMLVHLENLHNIDNTTISDVDKMIESAAMRLQQTLGPGYQASRFGDTVFAVLAYNVSKQTLFATARALRGVLETEPYKIGNHQRRLYVSIGISSSEDGESNALALIGNADLAANVARERDEEHIHIYNPQTDQQEATSHQQRLLEEISKAVEQQRMSLVFQPIVYLRADRTERYEVLLRMRNQDDREIIPEVVFSSAQDLRLGLMLDRWVIAHCLPILRQRSSSGLKTNLFINISPAILQDPSLANWLQEGFSRAQVDPNSLIFELPEATASENLPALTAAMAPLKQLGCGLSLDHFGHPNHSSLKLIDELAEAGLNLDYVKLDPTFVHDFVGDEDKQKRLRALIARLNEYNITTIAGCVEDSPTLYTLMTCGIEYAQGYFLQRPQAEMSYDFASLELEELANSTSP